MATRKDKQAQETEVQAATGQAALVGLRQVATTANVSTATVSRAINTPDLVSPKLRERINEAIDRLGWVPDGTARALATKRSSTIGAVFPTLTHGDFARATTAMQQELQKRGYTLLLACSDYDVEQEFQQIKKFIERGVDGLILVGENHHPELAKLLARRNVPTINTFVYSPETHGSCIGPDNRKLFFDMTKYLIDMGHQVFAVVAQSVENNDRAEARLQGIQDALAEQGIAVRPQHFAIGQWSISEGRHLFHRVMTTQPRPTAVICGNPSLAVGAYLESLAMGLKVPDDVSIVGYDDIEVMSHLPVSLTTVRVQSEQVGRNAARYLVGRLEGEDVEIPFQCDTEIVIRESSGPPPAGQSKAETRQRR
jgi:LacI family transcriptional regulator